MQLPPSIAQKFQELFSGANPSNLIKIGITATTLTLTLIAAVASGGATSPESDAGDADTSGETPLTGYPDYVAPSLEVQTKLSTIEDEVYNAINEMRQEQHLGMAIVYPARQAAAQYKAQENAVTGQEGPVEENISMLQAHLPLAEASGYEFIERLRNSEQHAAVFMEPSSVHMAVSAAYSAGDDTVWLVLQFD
ncbi:CAP domain-containing protein [Corynebacterium sp.]|uniref:CAP domain-containing protein n=1 Tax=Corynebacterium sp. TaxID=1720 RepID=UPI0026475EB1|nr:CAP domain-containing protein [Corynebacterium sp.]MDN6136191.1 CAP domain-containing protein [Corynebacterium sp.]MDN6737299.1 CAP domain-containing protein [Corynebacterium sp.]